MRLNNHLCEQRVEVMRNLRRCPSFVQYRSFVFSVTVFSVWVRTTIILYFLLTTKQIPYFHHSYAIFRKMMHCSQNGFLSYKTHLRTRSRFAQFQNLQNKRRISFSLFLLESAEKNRKIFITPCNKSEFVIGHCKIIKICAKKFCK